ncbi:acyltransferase family protein [Oscillospiraceae bacterium MB08-C2-2]|nr:acyltransferase family protein [Oscillospiraceae bacterium MB08-C2-2]
MREYSVDNLRCLVVLLLFPYHTFMIYNSFGESFYIKGTNITFTSNFIVAVWPWIMPLLFVVAGMSSAYALRKRTPLEYLKERVMKLFIPLISGILLIMPLMTYFAERFHNGYTGGYIEQYVLFFTKPTDLSGYHGGFTPGHFWFILYLFVISLVALPVMKTYQKSKRKIPIGLINLPLLLAFFVIPLACQIILNISGKSVGKYFAFFLLGYFILSDERILEKLDRYRFLLTGMFILGMAINLVLFNTELNINAILYEAIIELYAWVGILALLGMSKHYLNIITAAYFSKSSFSVYIFHQPWIIIIAFYVFQFTQNTVLQMALILAGSIPLTFLSYELCKRIGILRFIFGLKK